MNFDPDLSEELNFDPSTFKTSIDMANPLAAEALIVAAIVQGSGGPENAQMTQSGLRFIRHILSNRKQTQSGFMPNFKDMEAIRALARNFIIRSGGPSLALHIMDDVIRS